MSRKLQNWEYFECTCDVSKVSPNVTKLVHQGWNCWGILNIPAWNISGTPFWFISFTDWEHCDLIAGNCYNSVPFLHQVINNLMNFPFIPISLSFSLIIFLYLIFHSLSYLSKGKTNHISMDTRQRRELSILQD